MTDKKQHMLELLESFKLDLEDEERSDEFYLDRPDVEMLILALEFAMDSIDSQNTVLINGVRYVPERTQE